jgi:hypothetical protein
MQSALGKANTVMENADATQIETDAILSDLTSAIDALVLLGDVNFDGNINSTDALLTLTSSVKPETFTDKQKEAGDVNKDYKIAALDALKILYKASGRMAHF